MTRDDIRAKFRAAEAMFRKYKFNTSPIYLEFLQGKREMTCTAWANPTRNIKGWKGPCYLITDIHHDSLRRPVEQDRLGEYGYGKDPRCENCMVHVGLRDRGGRGRQRPAGRHTQDDQVATHLGRLNFLIREEDERAAGSGSEAGPGRCRESSRHWPSKRPTWSTASRTFADTSRRRFP